MEVVYPLPAILLVALRATLGGAEGFAEITRWGQRKLDFLRRLPPFEHGVASHDRLNDVVHAQAASLFASVFALISYRRLSAAIEACDRCIATRTARVVTALPWSTMAHSASLA